MQHTSKTDPRRSPRHAPQHSARLSQSGARARENDQNEQADEAAAPLRRPRPAPASAARQRPRRAARKAGKLRRAHLAMLTISGLGCLVLLAMISIVRADYREIKARADSKATLLAVLREQQRIGERRLAVLESGGGHEELLLDHGYIRPGDRILLFPATPEERRRREIPKNDLAPHPPAPHPPLITEDAANATTASAWQRAGAVLGGWWRTLKATAGLKN
ncbi:MAG TPA: hypothetical protein VNA16_05305 [Abditibacteriaceae bacterium]|nr:hypothetical protein [Abditibacteriaceae bacterium]